MNIPDAHLTRLRDLPPLATVAYIAIATNAGCTWRAVGQRLGRGRSTVKVLLGELVDAGLIEAIGVPPAATQYAVVGLSSQLDSGSQEGVGLSSQLDTVQPVGQSPSSQLDTVQMAGRPTPPPPDPPHPVTRSTSSVSTTTPPCSPPPRLPPSELDQAVRSVIAAWNHGLALLAQVRGEEAPASRGATRRVRRRIREVVGAHGPGRVALAARNLPLNEWHRSRGLLGLEHALSERTLERLTRLAGPGDGEWMRMAAVQGLTAPAPPEPWWCRRWRYIAVAGSPGGIRGNPDVWRESDLQAEYDDRVHRLLDMEDEAEVLAEMRRIGAWLTRVAPNGSVDQRIWTAEDPAVARFREAA